MRGDIAMEDTDSFYIVALREPGSGDRPQAYALCKAIAMVRRDVRTAAAEGVPSQHRGADETIATFLDGEFAPDAATAKYEAISWSGKSPIFDGSPVTALFLGTANDGS